MATADTSVQSESASAIYQFQGTLLEACNCDVLCPCWIGEDPDNGTCSSVVAYHLDSGTIRGVDVSGLTLANVVFIPGNVLAGNWKQACSWTTARATSSSRRSSTRSRASSAVRWPTWPS